MQEGICADAASFDLPAAHLETCIQEAKACVDLAIARRGNDNAADTSIDPENFAVLKGTTRTVLVLVYSFLLLMTSNLIHKIVVISRFQLKLN